MLSAALNGVVNAQIPWICPAKGLDRDHIPDSQAKMTQVSPHFINAPSLLDPRVMVLVPPDQRTALQCLWNVEARLFQTVIARRETMLAQIKLAWWRERLGELSQNPAALPKGEPLLVELADHWAGSTMPGALVDPVEAAMLAEDEDGLDAAAAELACAIQQAHEIATESGIGLLWARLRCGQMAANTELAHGIWQRAIRGYMPTLHRSVPNERPLAVLDQWALQVAQRKGQSGGLREAWLLFRAGAGL